MDKLASVPPEANPETLEALADQIVSRQSNVGNYILNIAIDFWLLRRLGLEPLSLPGRLVAWIFHFLMILMPALVLTAFTRDASGAALVSWSIVALFVGSELSMLPLVYRFAIPNHLSWVGAIVDEGDLHRLMTWCRRWYNCRVATLVAGALTLGTFVPFYLLAVRGSRAPVPAGTLYVGVWMVFMIMQAAYAWSMMSLEAYNLTTCSYELYRLSPADSVVVRRSLYGYNQLGLVNVLAVTAATLFVLVLLPAESGLAWPVVLFLLLVEYLSAGVGIMLPLVVLGRIIRRTKEEEMQILQVQLDELLPRVRELSEEEYEEMTRLQRAHDTIRDSPENLLPLGAILRTVGALFLSTATILVTAFAQEWIAEWAKRIVP